MAGLFPSTQGAASEEDFRNANKDPLAFSETIGYLFPV